MSYFSMLQAITFLFTTKILICEKVMSRNKASLYQHEVTQQIITF
jgi:hypothetical protein